MKATIYIPDDKAELYEKAKEKLGGTISSTFLRCIERELEAKRMATEKIVVEVTDQQSGRATKKAFEGRWLIGDSINGEQYSFDEAATGISGTCNVSVAFTKRQRIAVLEWNQHGETREIATYDNFEEFAQATADNKYRLYPESLVSAVADELDIQHIESLDI